MRARGGGALLAFAVLVLVLFVAPALHAQAAAPSSPPAASSPEPWRLAINLEGGEKPGEIGVGLQIVIVMTLLTVAPSLVLLMTCFTRLVIVLGLVRTALGVANAPANQIVIGLSLFLTFFIMGPVFRKANEVALQPYMAGEMRSMDALKAAAEPAKEFMLKQTRTRDLEFFLQLGRFPPTRVQDLPLRVIVPAFVISELQTAFQMGFLLFLPFLVVDLLVSSTLMSLGMMMMPPAIVSLPFKLLLFVLVDGWYLVVRSLVESFNV
ncbi:flagellar biosynthesis protein FliP [Opitutaceae bacterium TAV5]|nr:flagellar biosynthesis protein FliP [Opitutaceae bacterium TAV5]